jgi:hypothetical protein
MTTKDAKWTEYDVFLQLQKVMPPPAYVWLPQVRNGTGFAKSATRTADALGLSVWPSRGLFFVGVEVKVTRSDWRHELAQPEKAAEIEKYCRQWYIASPRGVVPEAELPETWGLIEVTRTTAEIVKAAAVQQTTPPDMLFTCAVLRAVTDCMAPKESIQARVDERVDKLIDAATCKANGELADLRANVEAFEKASGLKFPSWHFECQRLGELVALLKENNVTSPAAMIQNLRKTAETIVGHCDKAMEAMR